MHALEQDRATDFPGCHRLPDGHMLGIKAAHKADSDESPPHGLFLFDDFQSLGSRDRQRLFTEHRLVLLQTRMHKLCMGGIGRGNHHSIHSIILDQLQRV